MGLRKLWPDLQISVKILFWGDFASRCLKFFTKLWSQILEPGSHNVSNLPFYTPRFCTVTLNHRIKDKEIVTSNHSLFKFPSAKNITP